MQARLILPALGLLYLLLQAPCLRAQGRPLGPWRLTHQMTNEKNGDGWEPKAVKTVPMAVEWDVVPDSIRLFLNCENPLIAPAQPHKGHIPIRFRASGATVRLDVKHQRLLIVPYDLIVILSAYRGHVLVFKHVFKVIPPPLPVVECWYSGGIQPNDSPLDADWHILNLKAIPNPYFASLMPDDAKFRIPCFSLTLLRSNRPATPLQIVNGPQAGIKISSDSVQSGDQFQVNVDMVQRQNFRGEVANCPLQKQLVIPIQFK